jgi:hypothetical protein
MRNSSRYSLGMKRFDSSLPRWILMMALSVACLGIAPVSNCEAQQVSVKQVPTLRITTLDAGGAEPLGRVAGVTLDSRDRVILADASVARIVAYDERGRPRLSSGREGSGPGEYSMIDWVGSCLPGDSIVVYDFMRKELSILDSRLAFIRKLQLTGRPSGFSCTTDGNLYFLDVDLRSAPTDRPSWRGDAALRHLDLSRGSVTTTVAEHQPVADLANLNGMWVTATHGRSTSLAAFGEQVMVSTGDSAGRAIRGTGGGAPRYFRPVNWPAIEPTEATRRAAALAFTSRVRDQAMAKSFTKMLLDSPNGRPVDVFYHRVLIDPLDAVWTQRSLPGEPEVRLEIESVDGKHLGSVTLPIDGDVLAVGRTRLVVLTDIDDAPAVLVYAIERGG